MSTTPTAADPWAATRSRLNALLVLLEGTETAACSLAELEELVQREGRSIERQALQDRLHLQSRREQQLSEVTDAEGVRHPSVEANHRRTLSTVVGEVEFQRLAYRQRGAANLHPADAALQLPDEQYSYGLQRLSAIEAAKVSFGEAVEGVREATRAPKAEVHKRQLEELVQRAAVDFDGFYAEAKRPLATAADVLGLSFDGKGIVMLPDALRPATAAAAARAGTKLTTRLSKGEKANRKRMAEVGAVFTVTPVPRTPADILGPPGEQPRSPAPTAKDKWVMASVALDSAAVIARVFDEAGRRDPEHRCTWLALVDGNNDQLTRIQAEAKARHVQVTIVVDLIHVLEYLWKAAWCFFPEANPEAEAWVREKGRAVLGGDAAIVAAAVRRKATCLHLKPDKRKNADSCANYLLRKAPYLDYSSALRLGWPIATGVIEGTCRHLVKDRMDITGARWGLDSAEAVLKLRALRTNGDFDSYWRYHLAQEHARVHQARYADHAIPGAF